MWCGLARGGAAGDGAAGGEAAGGGAAVGGAAVGGAASGGRWGGGRWGGGRLLLLLLLLITSSEYCEGCQSKKGFRDRGGRLRTRDLQMTTNPCVPESCLAAPRSAHL